MAPSKPASVLRDDCNAGSSPLVGETEALFMPLLIVRGVDCDLASVRRASCSKVAPGGDEELCIDVGVCVAEVERLSGGALAIRSGEAEVGCERYSLRYTGYFGGGSDLIGGLAVVTGGLDSSSVANDLEAAADAESTCTA